MRGKAERDNPLLGGVPTGRGGYGARDRADCSDNTASRACRFEVSVEHHRRNGLFLAESHNSLLSNQLHPFSRNRRDIRAIRAIKPSPTIDQAAIRCQYPKFGTVALCLHPGSLAASRSTRLPLGTEPGRGWPGAVEINAFGRATTGRMSVDRSYFQDHIFNEPRKRNPERGTQKEEPRKRNPERGTQKEEPRKRNPERGTQKEEPRKRNPERGTQKEEPRKRNPERGTQK